MKQASAYLQGIDIVTGVSTPAVDELLEETDAQATGLRAVQELEAARALHPFTLQAAPPPRLLKSELRGVSDVAWTEFVRVMKRSSPNAVSASHSLGMFEMKLRRLADLGLIKNVQTQRTSRTAWVGEWVAPMSEKAFLASPTAQYKVFQRSMEDYVERIRSGQIEMVDPDMTLSGALAVLHRCGPSGLVSWQDEERRFPETVALYEAANGLF